MQEDVSLKLLKSFSNFIRSIEKSQTLISLNQYIESTEKLIEAAETVNKLSIEKHIAEFKKLSYEEAFIDRLIYANIADSFKSFNKNDWCEFIQVKENVLPTSLKEILALVNIKLNFLLEMLITDTKTAEADAIRETKIYRKIYEGLQKTKNAYADITRLNWSKPKNSLQRKSGENGIERDFKNKVLPEKWLPIFKIIISAVIDDKELNKEFLNSKADETLKQHLLIVKQEEFESIEVNWFRSGFLTKKDAFRRTSTQNLQVSIEKQFDSEFERIMQVLIKNKASKDINFLRKKILKATTQHNSICKKCEEAMSRYHEIEEIIQSMLPEEVQTKLNRTPQIEDIVNSPRPYVHHLSLKFSTEEEVRKQQHSSITLNDLHNHIARDNNDNVSKIIAGSCFVNLSDLDTQIIKHNYANVFTFFEELYTQIVKVSDDGDDASLYRFINQASKKYLKYINNLTNIFSRIIGKNLNLRALKQQIIQIQTLINIIKQKAESKLIKLQNSAQQDEKHKNATKLQQRMAKTGEGFGIIGNNSPAMLQQLSSMNNALMYLEIQIEYKQKLEKIKPMCKDYKIILYNKLIKLDKQLGKKYHENSWPEYFKDHKNLKAEYLRKIQKSIKKYDKDSVIKDDKIYKEFKTILYQYLVVNQLNFTSQDIWHKPKHVFESFKQVFEANRKILNKDIDSTIKHILMAIAHILTFGIAYREQMFSWKLDKIVQADINVISQSLPQLNK